MTGTVERGATTGLVPDETLRKAEAGGTVEWVTRRALSSPRHSRSGNPVRTEALVRRTA